MPSFSFIQGVLKWSPFSIPYNSNTIQPVNKFYIPYDIAWELIAPCFHLIFTHLPCWQVIVLGWPRLQISFFNLFIYLFIYFVKALVTPFVMNKWDKMTFYSNVLISSIIQFLSETENINDAISQNLRKHLSCNFTQMWVTVLSKNWYISFLSIE